MFQGFLLGLSVNIGCIAVCSPVIIPFLLIGQQKPLFPIIRFMAGRLVSYLLFAASIGYIGLYFEGRINPRIYASALVILSTWLILYASGKIGLDIPLCRWTHAHIHVTNFPFLAGIVMGFNICPPFLMGLSLVLDMGSVLKALFFFAGFYIGSSIWLLPLLFAGFLSNKKIVRIIGQSAAFAAGIWYLYRGVSILLE